MRWRAGLGHRPLALPAPTSHVVPAVSGLLLTLRAAVGYRLFASSIRILRHGRRSTDEECLTARTGQDVPDVALTAPPLRVASPCVFCTRCMTIMIDSPQPGLTPPRTASGQNAALRYFHRPNVAAMRWRGLLGCAPTVPLTSVEYLSCCDIPIIIRVAPLRVPLS